MSLAALEAEGHQRHLRVRPRRHGGQARTTAFTVRSLDRRAITWLRIGGLSEDEIDAIMQLGIGEDELHALILEAIDQEEQVRNRSDQT